MATVQGFVDGLTNVFNSLVNRRNAQNQNSVHSKRLPDEQHRQVYKTGVGNRIVRIKAGHALNDTIQFASTQDKEFYQARLDACVKRATKFMLAYGRGVVVMFHPGDDVSKPLREVDESLIKLKVFSGDIVTVSNANMDLLDDRYYKPEIYSIRGESFHHTRVVDFTYVEPPEFEAAEYRYGGISEFELIYPQIINDGVVERATTTILEKSSSFIYKIKGFKESLRNKKDDDLIKYFSRIADMRGIYGDVLIDSDDEATSVTQQLSNLAETNENSLRRLSMVTGLPLPWLVGENVKGMNAVGENERQIFQDTIESLQSDYILAPANELMHKFKKGRIEFKENQGETPASRITFEKEAINNAALLHQMGEDSNKYLTSRDVVEKDDWESYWTEKEESGVDSGLPQLPDMSGLPPQGGEVGESSNDKPDGSVSVDPTTSLNGAQVTAILDVIERVRIGEVTKEAATQVIAISFPVSVEQAKQLVDAVEMKGLPNDEA